MAAVLLIGVRHVGTGVLTLGELLMVMAYMNQLYEPLKTISRKAATLQLHLASAERAFALLDEPPDVEVRSNAQLLGRARGAIAFRNVSFAYGEDRPVLHDISFEVEPGTRLRSEEHTSELQSPCNLVCRLLLEKKNIEVLHTKDVARPEPGPNQELVPVRAAGINISEATIRSGAVRAIFPSTFPNGQDQYLSGL